MSQGLFEDFTGTGAPNPESGKDIYNYWYPWGRDSLLIQQELDEIPWTFGPHNSVMGPFTNPSTQLNVIDGCTSHAQAAYSGITFYNINWDTEPDGNNPGEAIIEVTVRYDPKPTGPHPLPDDMEITGTVQFTGDTEIEASETLIMAQGSRLIIPAENEFNSWESGGTVGSVDIEINGTFDVNGAQGDSVIITSSRDNGFRHYRVDGESSNPGPGNWHGLKIGSNQDVDTVFDDVNALQVRYAAGATNFATGTFPDLTNWQEDPAITFIDNEWDVTFDRDVAVSAARDIPENLKIGFAVGDASNSGSGAGADSTRTELIVSADLTSDGAVLLGSTLGTPAAGDWLGVRVTDLDEFFSTSADTVITIQHAGGAVVWDGTGFPDLEEIGSRVKFLSNEADVGFVEDYVAGASEVIQIDSAWKDAGDLGWKIGFGHDDQSSTNDPRVELVLGSGTLDIDGTVSAPVTFGGLDAALGRGSWYGVRVNDLSKITSSDINYLTIKDAGGAISLEGTAAASFPTLSTFDDITFTDNMSDICFDRDLSIDSNLTIPGGWRIGFTADNDEDDVGVDDELCELIIEEDGSLVAGDSTTARGAFTSNTMESEELSLNWYGVRHLEDWTYQAPTGYGYGWPDCDSEFENLEVAGAKYGFSLESLAAPEIKDVDFVGGGENPNKPFDIYLNHTDVTVPGDKTWSLNAGTRVIADSSTEVVVGQETTYNDYDVQSRQVGEDGKVDLIVQGTLDTFGSLGELVTFRSGKSGNDVEGDDWGGIFMDHTSGASVIDSALIADAENPLYFHEPFEVPTVSGSRFRYFGDVAIWMTGGTTGGVRILDNDILRNNQLNSDAGNTGILIQDCRDCVIDGNKVDLSGGGETWLSGAGIQILNTDKNNFCILSLSQPETINTISDNEVFGKGVNAVGDWFGIAIEWACSSNDMALVKVEGNKVEDWSDAGLDFLQCANVDVRYNCLSNNRQGLLFSRTSAFSGQNVGLRRNLLQLEAGSQLPLIQTDNSQKLLLGNGSPTGGENLLQIDTDSQFFIKETDTSTYDLNAKNSVWIIGLDEDEAETDSTVVRDEIDSTSPGSVLIQNLLEDDETDCSQGIELRVPPRRPGVEFVDETANREERQAPIVTSLSVPRPIPFGSSVEIPFAIAVEEEGPVRIDVFDVTGRRVNTLLDMGLESGVYKVRWTGDNSSGRSVSSGVYFVRLEAGQKRQVRKLVKLR